MEESGNTHSAVVARIQKAWICWNKMKGMLMQKGLSFRLKGWMYAITVRNAMTFSAETWAVNEQDIQLMERTQMRMLRWMAGVSRKEHRTNESIREAFHVEPISIVIRRSRLRWFGHVARRDQSHIARLCLEVDVEGKPSRGRPKLTWRAKVDNDMRSLKLKPEDALDRRKWKMLIR